MDRITNFLFVSTVLATLAALGCDSQGRSTGEEPRKPETLAGTDGMEKAHSHDDADVLVWELKEKIADTPLEVWWGHHGQHFHGGDRIEPAAMILRDGMVVADAEVFNSLVYVDKSGETIEGAEKPTIFEPATDAEVAHYAQGELSVPWGVDECSIRFRVLLADGQSIVRDTPFKIGH